MWFAHNFVLYKAPLLSHLILTNTRTSNNILNAYSLSGAFYANFFSNARGINMIERS